MLISDRSHLNEILPAVPESVPRARRLAAKFAFANGAAPAQVDAIRLSVSEAFTNAVVHGYRGRHGEVGITLGIAGDELWVLISDHGYGHQLPTTAPGLGWGLALIADASDEFVIAEGAQAGTEVRMRFALDPVVLESGGDDLLAGSLRDPARDYS
jgi:stage II sporulation protein AB (anti-sigma F factor)